jgi:opacity protein-like surface antigen
MGPGAALAQEDDEEEADFGRTGFYIGVGGALTSLLDPADRLEEEFADAGLSLADAKANASFGANGRVGYRFHSHFATEVEADWHYAFDIKGEYGTSDGEGEVKPLVFTANLKGYLFKDRFQPYAIVGVGAMTAEVEIDEIDDIPVGYSERYTGFAARLGGGADMYITENIVINAEIRYVLPTGAVEGLDMISFGWGLQYRF